MPRGVYKRKKQKAGEPTPPFSIHWSQWRGSIRVWRNDWFPDQFEVMSGKDFEDLQYLCRRLSIPLIEQID